MENILIVEDDLSLREALQETLVIAGFNTLVAEDGYSALNVLNQKKVDMIISDVAMNGMDGHQLLRELKKAHADIPVLLMTAYADITNAVQAIKEGAVDYIVKPFEVKQLIKTINHFVGRGHLNGNEVVAESQASKALFLKSKKVAKTDATVLIMGESGTGKEVIARHIHLNSPRADKPFVAINCAAIPENMLEATLFGYEKGAFTGAYQSNAGKFEQANHGTLLLDEITEMDLGLQAKLLRVLQERELERLGGKKLIQLDVRVIATTNRDLNKVVQEGRFRDDLYYRLNVFPLLTTALRERKDDIIPLVYTLLSQHVEKMKIACSGVSADAQARLVDYSWPGNVRELDNVIQRALILKNGNAIEAVDVQFEGSGVVAPVSEINETQNNQQSNSSDNLKQREYALIAAELRAQNGCRKATAEKLGISPRTLRYKLARMRESGFETV